MGTPIKDYLKNQKIERDVMKAFLQMYRTNYRNVRVQKWEPNNIEIKDLIDEKVWAEDLKEHADVFCMYNNWGKHDEALMSGFNYATLKWWDREHENAPKGIKNSFTKRRLDELLGLYKSIKKSGYVKKSGNLLKVIDTRNLEKREEPIWKDRVTPNYYRINGKRRLIICHYLGIKEIIVSVLKVRIVKL